MYSEPIKYHNNKYEYNRDHETRTEKENVVIFQSRSVAPTTSFVEKEKSKIGTVPFPG